MAWRSSARPSANGDDAGDAAGSTACEDGTTTVGGSNGGSVASTSTPATGGDSGASPFGTDGQFRSEKLAESVKSHLDSARISRAAGGGGADEEGGVSAQGLKLWVSERAPLLHHCLSTFMHTRCFLYGDARSQGVKGESFGHRGTGERLGSRPRVPPSLAAFSIKHFAAEELELAGLKE